MDHPPEPLPTDDPRLDGRHYRRVPAPDDGGDVVLVGVVHDHPASVFRSGRTVEALAPAVLALELPNLAVPLYAHHAGSATGDEMSAALAAAGDADVVGIDGPGAGYLRELAGRLPGADSLSTVRSVVGDAVSLTRTAVRYRAAAAVATLTGREPEVDRTVDHDVEPGADPSALATHETSRLQRSRALLHAVEPPPAVALVDEAREATMARRLAALRERGDVVAVVGFDHLDAVADGLGSRLDAGGA